MAKSLEGLVLTSESEIPRGGCDWANNRSLWLMLLGEQEAMSIL